MQGWQRAVAECKMQVVSIRENYKTIRTSLCKLVDTIRRSIQGDEPGGTLRNLERLEEDINAAGETVLSNKTGQLVLLDAVESLASSTILLLNRNQDESTRRTAEALDEPTFALIRCPDQDRNRNLGSEGQ